MVLKLSDTLIELHKIGISHNDLHVSNILVNYDDNGIISKIVITDFGIASFKIITMKKDINELLDMKKLKFILKKYFDYSFNCPLEKDFSIPKYDKIDKLHFYYKNHSEEELTKEEVFNYFLTKIYLSNPNLFKNKHDINLLMELLDMYIYNKESVKINSNYWNLFKSLNFQF